MHFLDSFGLLTKVNQNTVNDDKDDDDNNKNLKKKICEDKSKNKTRITFNDR